MKDFFKKYVRPIFVILILCIGCIFLYSFIKFANDPSLIKIISLCIIISIASFSVGGALGFIFGIPSPKNNLGQEQYERNNSLKEVSDWLTKIILGVSLVELKSGIKHFNTLVLEITKNINVDDSVNILVGALIIIFLITGFILIYIITITIFLKDLIDSDKAIKAIIEAANINPNELQITDLIKDDFKFNLEEKSAILKYVSEKGVKINDVYVAKRLAKALFHMKEYESAVLAYSWACELDKNDHTLKINEAFIRNKFLKEFEKSNNLLKEIIRDNPDWAVPHYNIACNYNREYRDLINNANISDYKRELITEIKKHLKEVFKLDRGLLSEALKDPELEGIDIQGIFDSIQ